MNREVVIYATKPWNYPMEQRAETVDEDEEERQFCLERCPHRYDGIDCPNSIRSCERLARRRRTLPPYKLETYKVKHYTKGQAVMWVS